MTESPLPDVEITADNFADFLPPEPTPLADLDAVQDAAETTPDDLSDDEILALDAEDDEEVDDDDTLTDDAASWAEDELEEPGDAADSDEPAEPESS